MSRMCTGRRLSGACQDWCDWDVETRFYEPCRAICDYAERTCPDTACRGFVERCMPTPLPPSPPSPPSSTPGPGGGGEGGSDVAVIIGAVFGPIAVCLLVALLVGLLVYLCRKRRWCFRRPVQNNQNNQDELLRLLPPAAVQNLATTVNADHNVTIEFSDPSRQSTHFDISVTAIQIAGDGPVVGNSGGRAVRVAAPANGGPVSHGVPALQPGTRYQVSVTPVRVEDDVAVPMNGVANGHAGGQGQGQGHQGQGHVDQAQGQDEGELPGEPVSQEFFTNPPAPTELYVVADVTSMVVQCAPVACRYGPDHRADAWVQVSQDGADQGQHEPVRMQVAGELMEGRVEGLTPSTTYTVVVYATIRQLGREPQVELRTDAEPRQERTLNHAIVQAAGDDTDAQPIVVPDPEDHDPSQRFRLVGIDRIETDAEASRFTRTRLGHGSSSYMSDAALPEPVRGMHSETSSEGPQPPI